MTSHRHVQIVSICLLLYPIVDLEKPVLYPPFLSIHFTIAVAARTFPKDALQSGSALRFP